MPVEDTVKTAEIKLSNLKAVTDKLTTQKAKLEAHLEHTEKERVKLLEHAQELGIEPDKIDELIRISEERMGKSIISCQTYIDEINQLLKELKENFG